MQFKTILQSKTFWLAVLQIIAGVAVVLSTSYPGIGGILIFKSIVDIVLRVATTQAIIVP